MKVTFEKRAGVFVTAVHSETRVEKAVMEFMQEQIDSFIIHRMAMAEALSEDTKVPLEEATAEVDKVISEYARQTQRPLEENTLAVARKRRNG